MANSTADQSQKRAPTFAPQVKLHDAKPSRNWRTSIILGMLATIMAVTLGLWVLFFQSDNNISIDLNNVTKTDEGRLELQGLTFRGKTASGSPYILRAETATEDATTAQLVHLTGIDGTIENAENGVIDLTSQTGKFHQTDNFVTLIGQVQISQSLRNILFTTEELQGNLDTGDFSSPTNVAVTSPSSSVEGQAMQVTGFGEKIIFKGKSKAIIGEHHDK